jgi:hypothetical protein
MDQNVVRYGAIYDAYTLIKVYHHLFRGMN